MSAPKSKRKPRKRQHWVTTPSGKQLNIGPLKSEAPPPIVPEHTLDPEHALLDQRESMIKLTLDARHVTRSQDAHDAVVEVAKMLTWRWMQDLREHPEHEYLGDIEQIDNVIEGLTAWRDALMPLRVNDEYRAALAANALRSR